ncbi:phospholipase A [Thermodesulfobacteriota bacterium]
MKKYRPDFFTRTARLSLVVFVVGTVLTLLADFSLAQGVERQAEEFDACLMRILKSAEDDLTVGRIKEICEAETFQVTENPEAPSDENALEKRVRQEDSTVNNLWTITPHKQNYILLGAKNFSSPYEEPWEESAGEDVDLNSTEVKFQVSFKFMLWEDIFKKNGDLYFAYTQLAMWQLYNRDISSPFRETNYEPEAFLAFDTAWNVFGLKNRFFLVGFSHQSNGREEPLSRSWNRIYANFILNRGSLVLSVKPWFRIPEDAATDDNPNIEDYLGYGELRALYRTGDNTFGMMLRNNLKFDNNRGAVQLDWSFPLPGTDRIKGFVQYFNGYGECLLDYNASTSRLGVGFLLTDFL